MLIDGARSAFDLNRDYNEELLAVRTAKAANRSDDELREVIRGVAGIRKLEDIPAVRAGDVMERQYNGRSTAAGTSIFTTDSFAYSAEDGKVLLPARRYSLNIPSTGTVIYLNDKGGATGAERIKELAQAGKTVVAVDLRGLGQTQGVGATYYNHDLFGTDGVDYYFAYLLGRSYVGMRTEDLLAVAKAQESKSVEIVADGEVAGLVALHAAALEPALIKGVTLDAPIRTWYDFVKSGSTPYPITNIVHGALLEYDVPDLQRLVK